MLKPDDALSSRQQLSGTRHLPTGANGAAQPLPATLAALDAADGWTELAGSWQRYEARHPVARV